MQHKNKAGGRRTKMQDVEEFKRWYADGVPYAEMVQRYKDKYNIDTTLTMFSGWRTRLGLRPRIAGRDEALLPWDIKPEHAWSTMMRLLQAEGRLRRGMPVTLQQQDQLAELKGYLEQTGSVIHYEPDTVEGFWIVPREDGDDPLVRPPHEN